MSPHFIDEFPEVFQQKQTNLHEDSQPFPHVNKEDHYMFYVSQESLQQGSKWFHNQKSGCSSEER
jgi:hypothetical protein